jgi:beta-glucanase (GH16 family)
MLCILNLEWEDTQFGNGGKFMKRKFFSLCLGMVMLSALFATPLAVNESPADALARDADEYVVPAVVDPVTPSNAHVISTTTGGTTRNWGITWSDEFNGTALNTQKWDYQNGTGQAEFGFPGWGNEEVQNYRHQNVFVQNGHLTLRAQRSGGQWFSGKLRSTKDGMWNNSNKPAGTPNNPTQTFAQTYGRFEARIRLPATEGTWPAFWMMPQTAAYGGWARSGEIDIMEAMGRFPNRSVGAIHFGGAWPENDHIAAYYNFPSGGRIDQWNTYAVEWEEHQIRWYVNGNHFFTGNSSRWWTSASNSATAPFDRDFHLILNLAIGGHFDGYRVPPDNAVLDMDVDWVRVYQRIPDAPEPPDIALNKTARASSQDAGNPASNGNNGNAGNRWAAVPGTTASCNEWWLVDLGAVYELSGFVIDWERAAANRYTIKTSVTDPGTTVNPNSNIWTTVFTKGSGGQGEGIVRENITHATGRYGRWVMMHATQRDFNWETTWFGPSFWRLSLHGKPAYGHVRGAADISAADVTLLRGYIAAQDKTAFRNANPAFNMVTADVNGDGFINSADVTLLRRWIAAVNKNTVPLGPRP